MLVVYLLADRIRACCLFIAALPTSPADHTRFKDRVSYAHQIMQVDLTKVTASAHADPRPSFELEVEIRDAKVLLKEAEKEARGEENVYLDMVQAFLNNIREHFSFFPFPFISPYRLLTFLMRWG